MENNNEISLKNKSGYSTSNPTNGLIPWENHSKIHMYPVTHCSTIYNSQDMEKNLSTDRLMHKELVVHLCNAIFVVAQLHSHVHVTLWTSTCQAYLHSPSPQVCPNYVGDANMPSVMPSSHLTLWWPRLLLASIFPSIRGF